MTELEIMELVITDPACRTNFDDLHWTNIDQASLNSCFDRGLIRWNAGKLSLTPLGSSTCGGDRLTGASMGANEREV
ncbi:hypothetical protein LCGC14_1593650 [marine sediment metagenome]|uniref:Uncharacterized protein n=1 Tax=marine sediment metagenome TaxID=412755 RepID=A0A0F9LDR4_9ZZZZ